MLTRKGLLPAMALFTTAVLATTCLAFAKDQACTIADFTKPHKWGNPHHVANVVSSDNGLSFAIDGEDPWLFGPTVEIPAIPAGPRRMAFTMTCAPTSRVNSWQLFFAPANRPYSEKMSCRLYPVGNPPYTRFATKGAVPFNLKGPCHFRLDPPGGSNETFTVKGLAMEWRKPLWSYAPQKAPPLVIPASTPLVLKGRGWELRHDPDRIGAFRFISRGKTVENLPAEPFVYVDKSGKVRTLDWSNAKMVGIPWSLGEISTSAQMMDADGRKWHIKRCFISEGDGDAMRVETIITASKDGELAKVLHVPALTLFVDRASNGRKHQAMLAGVEYLDDEPSSNTKEIRTHEHNRLIPAEYRLSAPMAVFTKDNSWFAATWGKPLLRFEMRYKVLGIWPRYKGMALVGGVWTESDKVGVSWPSFFATVFDTPDRLFNSGGHLLAFWAPAVGPERSESELDVYEPVPFQKAAHVVKFRAGEGVSVADALETYFKEKELPPPDAIDRTAALEQLAHGWLDSAIREGVKFKHAIGGHFKPGLVADAPVLMQHLASALDREPNGDRKLVARLRTTAAEVLAAVPKRDVGFTGVSHVRRPAPVLVAGDVSAYLARKDAELKSGNAALAGGKRIWKPQPGKPDFGATLGADHCNGYTAMALDGLLSAATWSGDEAEIAKALAIVDKATALYHGTVPRGAQPWEMPLHTPDIMASAHLVRIYTLAYLLKPDPAYLREARHWAYGGLSMVYLVLPPFDFGKVADPVGRYATCAVMGATHWVAPNWIGRPVQWCGLVYSAALWDLARIEPDHKAQEFWRTVATGITVSGARQNHTADEPRFVGLLPDSWDLEHQVRYPIPINPGTLQENFAEYVKMPFYSVRAVVRPGSGAPALVHAAGEVETLAPENGTLRCRVAAWPQSPSKVVVTRVAKPQRVLFAGAPAKFEYIPERRVLVVEIPANARGVLEVAESDAANVSFDAATIASNGVKVADWMLAHPKRANHRDWSYGAFYAGLAEFARATGERRYIDAIREEGRTYGWKFEKRDADVGNTHCIGQAWLDIARAERDDAVVASVRAELDAFMAAHVDAPLARREGEHVVLNRRRWYWCDALFMSPPVWAKLAAITGERKYLDFMMGEYRATYDHLYDREDHLFWRDARYVGRTTPNGKKLFWGRGNGWVLAGLPLVIRELPTDSAERRWFTALFKEMCAKVRTIQRADGAWSASLLDGKNPDAPEMSATAFFCYALAWGVNNGVLDEATYLPCIERAWAAMCRCVGEDGKFGWVQPIGESPVKNFGPDSTETYGAGGYLLAATELRRYALAHVSRVDQIAARLPERPCTPAPRPCDRAAWAPLANDPAAAAIIASAEKLVGAKIDELSDDLYRDFSRTGNRVRYETPYFRKAYRLNLFMVAEALEWKGRFVPEIRRYLESILDEKVWTIPATDTKDLAFVKGQPVICLFSANRAWIVAYAANWFADVLPPELVARAKSECRRRVLDLYLTACRNPSLAKGGGGDPLWWFFARTNWSPVCHAGCVGAALAILDSRRERAECLEAVERAMPHYFQGFGRDGYCSEGMGYWNYGFGHYVALRAMAEQATGGFVTFDSPMAASVAAYAVNFQLENGLSPHFADGGGAPDLSLLDLCHRFWPTAVPSSGVGPLSLNKGDSASFSPCPACAFIALRAFGTSSVQQQGGTVSVQQQGGTSSVQQQGGTASVQQQGGRAKSCCSTLVVSPAPLPMRSVFPHSQVYLMRPGGGKGGIALGAKGGHNAELHNHNDVGSYAISLGGEVLCGDVGGELYSRRTFSSRRYESEVLNSFGHPVPRPGVLQGLGRRYAARIIRTEFRPNRDTVVFDLTGAYPSKTLKRLHRKFIYDRAAQTVTIRDEVDFKEPTAFDDPLTTLVGVDGRAATAGVTTSVRQQGTGLVFVGKKGRLAVDVETSGGEWEWDVRTMDNGRGELPVAKDAPEGKWAIWVAGKTQNTPPDGRPRRIAVKFKKPVMSAMVEFHFRAVDANIPEPENVPELMRTFAGEEVKTKEAWEKVRAPELLERFQKDVYGRRPAVLDERKRISFKVYDERPVMDGKAVRKLVRAEFDGPLGKFLFPFTVYIPKAQKPVPAFVSICLKSRSKVAADHVITSVCWPVEQIVGRGYATIGFLTEDIATEKNTGFAQGVFTCVEKPEVRTDESWGTISAWAWAASRVIDWIETEPTIDATRVGIVGHSRGGKTAIWTGVTDRRFALVCSNNSGAHGAKLNHIRLPKSEDIASIPKYFPNWYCGNYPKKYGGKEMTMDFDQHELLALIAPRRLCVGSASEDAWAGQPGEWWSAKLASPAWELYGKKGLVAERFPAPGEKQQEGSVSYHLRPGKHSLDPYDWDRYMDFADKNL